jgi:hypothetical protein
VVNDSVPTVSGLDVEALRQITCNTTHTS